MGCLFWQRWEKRREKKKEIKEPFAGLFTEGNLAPLKEAGCRRDERGAKVPAAPGALAKSRSRALIPFPRGFWHWGEGAKTLAPPAEPPRPLTPQSRVGVFLSSSKAAHFLQALNPRSNCSVGPLHRVSPRGMIPALGGSVQWMPILGLHQCPRRSFPTSPEPFAITHGKTPQKSRAVGCSQGEAEHGEAGEPPPPKALPPQRMPM